MKFLSLTALLIAWFPLSGQSNLRSLLQDETKFLQELTRELALTTAQQPKMKAAYRSWRQTFDVLVKEKPSLTKEAFQSRRLKNRSRLFSELQSILNREQQVKLKQLIQEWRNKK